MAVRLPRDRTCASVARQLLQQRARADLTSRELEDASLIVSELATNAFLHGEGTIVMTVRRGEDRLRLEVCDEGNPMWIDVISEAERDAGGYGLWLVSQLGSDWGTVGTSCVWAELVLDDATRTPGPAA
jgi:anti-sigma regulatory factor (Ser/Thr protein kinase)